MFFFLLANIIAKLQILDNTNFTVGKFNYKIKEGSTNQVEIIKSQCPSQDSNLEIPTTIQYNGNTYTVTSIGEEAFKGCQRYVGNLIVPEGITFIGYKAFANCGFTGSLTFNAQVDIDASLFSNTDKWKGSLTIGNKVPSIGDRAFDGIFQHTTNGKLTIGTGVKSIGSFAFYNCLFSGQETIIIPTNVEKLGGQFLSQFKGAKNLELRCTLNELKQIDMLGLESFETLKITNTKTIGEKCLFGYTTFKTVTITNAATYKSYAFSHTSFDQDLTIPETVTSIGIGCFSNSKWTGSLYISAKIYEIDPSMFSKATFGGSELVIKNVESIGAQAFENCFTSEISIEMSNVKAIGSLAFYNCQVGDVTIPKTVNRIGRAAFMGAIGDTLSIDSSSLTSTNSTWFEGKNQFKSLNLGANVKIISESTFANNKNFPEGLTIKGKITKIADKAFYNCSGFSGSLTIPETVTSIGQNCFSFCSGFTRDLVINANVAAIDNTMFSELSGFEGSLIIGPNINTIGARAFEEVTCFKENLIIGSKVKSIGPNAFYNTRFSGSLTIPENVENIDSKAFMKSSFTSLNLTRPNVKLGLQCFYEMGSLSTVTLCSYDDVLINNSIFSDNVESFTVVVPSNKAANIMDSKLKLINVVSDATISSQTENSIVIQPDDTNTNKKSKLTFNDIKSSDVTIRSFNDVTVNLASNSPLIFDDTSSITVNASKPVTINEVKVTANNNKVNFRSSDSEVLIQKVTVSGYQNQKKSVDFNGNSKIKAVQLDSGINGTLSNSVVSGFVDIRLNSNLVLNRCEIRSSSIINFTYRNFQSKTRLIIAGASNKSSLLDDKFQPGQVNVKFSEIKSTGEAILIERIGNEKCQIVLRNITLPSEAFSAACQDGNLVIKHQEKKEKESSGMVLYIVIGVVGFVAVALVVVLIIVFVKRKDLLKKKEKENNRHETLSLRSTLL